VRLEEHWRRYAARKRFGFAPAVGAWPHARTPRIDARVGDVEVFVEACTLTVAGAPRPCTRAWGRALQPIVARVLVSSDARLMQGPGVHELFDLTLGALHVRASSAWAIDRWLGPNLRAGVHELLARGVLQYDDGEVSLTWIGEETRASVLDQACGIVACACVEVASPPSYR
jgi:hypothetical protein